MLRLALPRAVIGALLCVCAALACTDNAGTVTGIKPRFSQSPNGRAYAYGNRRLVQCSTREPHFNSALITPGGGWLQVGPNRLVVPPHALDRAIELTGAVRPLTVVNIEFGPEGLQFEIPAELTLNTAGCAIPPGATPYIVYVQNGEIEEVIPSVFDALHNKITGPIHHFSGYSIAFADDDF